MGTNILVSWRRIRHLTEDIYTLRISIARCFVRKKTLTCSNHRFIGIICPSMRAEEACGSWSLPEEEVTVGISVTR
jgi:hypothetical protein